CPHAHRQQSSMHIPAMGGTVNVDQPMFTYWWSSESWRRSSRLRINPLAIHSSSRRLNRSPKAAPEVHPLAIKSAPPSGNFGSGHERIRSTADVQAASFADAPAEAQASKTCPR